MGIHNSLYFFKNIYIFLKIYIYTREYPVQKRKKMEANSRSTKLRENLAVELKSRNTNIPENFISLGNSESFKFS
jgi:hypothetical protein